MPKLEELFKTPSLFEMGDVSLFDVDFMQEDSITIEILFDKLASNDRLRSISLRACRLFSYDLTLLKKIFDFLSGITTLEKICLAQNGLNHKNLSAVELAASSLRNPALREINLESNFLFQDGSGALKAVETLFRNHPFLRVVNLRGNAIGNLSEIDLQKLFEALASSPLEDLNLLANKFEKMSELSFVGLLGCLSSMRDLKCLDLSFNNFTDKPLSALIDFLKHSSVDILFLNGCSMALMKARLEDWLQLLKVLAERNCVKRLEINSNQLEILNAYTDTVDRLLLMVRFSRLIGQWSQLRQVNLGNNDLGGRDDLLIFLVRTLLMRSPELGLPEKSWGSQIAKDFQNTGCRLCMDTLIQEAKKRLKEQCLIAEETQRLFLVTPVRAEPKDQKQATSLKIGFKK